MSAPRSEDEGAGGDKVEAAATAPPRREITQAPITATVIGLAAGAFSALLGVGGGLLMVPAMVYLLRVRPHRAHGTSLAVVLPVAMAGVSRYAQAGRVAWGGVIPLALGGVVGALIGAMAANALGAGRMKRLFGALAVVIGGAMIVVPGSYGRHLALGTGGPGLAGLAGLAAGVVSGLLGVGGGIVMVPAMVFLLGWEQHLAQGVSLAVIVLVSISGALIHARKGNVIATLAFWLSVGGVIGALAVGGAVQRLNSETLRSLFAVLLVITGVTTIARPVRPAEAVAGSQ